MANNLAVIIGFVGTLPYTAIPTQTFVSTHEDLAKEIDAYMKRSKKGYRSRAEVVSDAVRRLLDEK